MRRAKTLSGECQRCGGYLEFPAESIGLTAQCPHCQQQTELFLARPRDEPLVPRKVVVLTVASILILVLGLVGAMMAVKRAERLAAQKKAPPSAGTNAAGGAAPTPAAAPPTTDPLAQKGFKATTVRLETSPGTSLVYAVGTLKNGSDRRRFGVRVVIDLLDQAGLKVGTAKDYRALLEPGAEWNFKALVVDSKAAAATLASVEEDQ